ncbi:Protein SRG1 [Hordeum vulgare]|nr:Protein SRG1 [Hordeum vulgare]
MPEMEKQHLLANPCLYIDLLIYSESSSETSIVTMEYSQKFKILDIPPVVQELVAGGVQEPPVQYVVPEQDRPAAVSEMPEPIPVIDLGRLSANNAEEFAKLQSALENWGFFLVNFFEFLSR